MKIKVIRIASVLLAIAVLLPFVVNLCGRNLFLYIHLGDRDLVFAATNGISHNSLVPPIREIMASDPSLGGGSDLSEIDLINLGPVEIFGNARHRPMQRFHFSLVRDTKLFSRHGVEFPWLLLLLFPAALWLATSKFFANRKD